MNMKNVHPAEKSGFLAAAFPLAMITLITMLAFANAWPDRLVFDDKAFAGPGRAPELDSLVYIFTHDVWAPIGADAGLYRPLLLLQLSLETRLFGESLEGYHLSNILQHVLVGFLLYGFLRLLLRMTGNQSASGDLCALLATLVFAVHPIHTEVVNSVFNRSDMMVALFGLGGLWWLLYFLDSHPGRAWFGIAVTYFLAMLSKESAIVIPGLAVALIMIVTPGDATTRIRRCLPALWLFLPLTLYLILRANALFQPELEDATQGAEGSGLQEMLRRVILPDPAVLFRVSGVFGQALKALAWPFPLQLNYSTPSTPLLVGYAALNLVLIGAALVQLGRKRHGLAAGLAFFYLAMLPANRIIGMGEAVPHFAERYAYFPSVGMAILLAFALSALARRFSPRGLAGIAAPVLLVFTALTWDRNADWQNEVSLFGTEYQRGDRSEPTLRWVTSAHLKSGNIEQAIRICDENLASQEKYGYSGFVESCATAYEQQRRYEDAERAHLYAIKHEKTRMAASMSLARLYVRHKRPQDAQQHFMAAIEWSDDPADRAKNTAEMLISLNPNSREQGIVARGYLEEALQLRPGWPEAERMLRAVEQALNSSRNPQS